MDNSIDLIAHQINECVEKIDAYHCAISHLRQKIRELSWQIVEADDGEISHYDDVA
jgi:peptidoglycan hydrolase CwlO-like protein